MMKMLPNTQKRVLVLSTRSCVLMQFCCSPESQGATVVPPALLRQLYGVELMAISPEASARLPDV
jgi:hypothetical protein